MVGSHAGGGLNRPAPPAWTNLGTGRAAAGTDTARVTDTVASVVERAGHVLEQEEEPSHHEQGDDRNHERVLNRGDSVLMRPKIRDLCADIHERRAQQEHSSAPPFPPQGPPTAR